MILIGRWWHLGSWGIQGGKEEWRTKERDRATKLLELTRKQRIQATPSEVELCDRVYVSHGMYMGWLAGSARHDKLKDLTGHWKKTLYGTRKFDDMTT